MSEAIICAHGRQKAICGECFPTEAPAKPLHVRVGIALGVEPLHEWALMNREETGIYDAFDSPYKAAEELADHQRRYPRGLYVTEGAHVVERLIFPRYDTDWSATGPLIERLHILIGYSAPVGEWKGAWFAAFGFQGAYGDGYIDDVWDSVVEGETPLRAACALILALHEAGKLPK